jgi:hypothetical protein
MGYWIPVCYFSIDRSDVPRELENWLSVETIISARWERPDDSSFRFTTSRNWWHQDALDQICKGLGVEGLEFIHSEVACLCGQELQTASAALDRVIQQITAGLPPLGDHEVEHGSVWWMRQYESEGSFKDVFEKARPTFKASASKDVGFEATVAFCSFVKSLRAAVGEAIDEGKCLLYVQPQP